MKNVKVTRQSKSGRNLGFKNTSTGRYMNRQTFVKAIKAGNYKGYHVRKINGIDTPCSNPDKSANNNLD
ncbi:hypothetical protein [Lagierella massiliensis]|uniref:hypothetical protein n=1 Tax=Lagierella massiliensis TaxID=1689303 RepID=UPI0006D7D4D4|nr:hypothetical protein [Lagierella massiliensis]